MLLQGQSSKAQLKVTESFRTTTTTKPENYFGDEGEEGLKYKNGY